MRFSCKVITRASRNEVIGTEKLSRLDLGFAAPEEAPEIRIYTTAVPVGGKANREVIALLSQALKVPRGRIRIVRGETSNKKIIEIDDSR